MKYLELKSQEVKSLQDMFLATFGTKAEYFFSAPGRTEISGNHTDHQRGKVLAAAVNLDTRAAVNLNGENFIRVKSEGYPICKINLDELLPVMDEINSTASLVRGVAAKFKELGCDVKGFDAYCQSNVLSGSGLSSSAAFEVLIGTIINSLFFEGKISAPQIAQIGQYAENVFFGKPCGLMDQMASSVGGLVGIDFFKKDNPEIQSVDFDFSACGHALCIIDSKASHADLTDEYAAVPNEIKAVCAELGKDVLSEIDEDYFYSQISSLRKKLGDRPVMRCIHFYDENKRVPKQIEALKNGDFSTFLKLVQESGESSWMYLQNVIPLGYKEHQDMAIALGLCKHFLKGKGAFRVHGGGFAGTVQAYVPFELLDDFKNGIDKVLGENACKVLSIRNEGGVQIKVVE